MDDERARLIAGICLQVDALARRRYRAQMPRPPPSPLHVARRRRARHWKARMTFFRHVATIATMLAVVAFIALCYHALTIYSARQGYGGMRSDVARVGIALFLGGVLVGWVACAAWGQGRSDDIRLHDGPVLRGPLQSQ